MKSEDAQNMFCVNQPDVPCAGKNCMGWIALRPDSDEGNCVVVVSRFTMTKAMTPKGQPSAIVTPR